MLTVGTLVVTALREALEYFVWQGPPRRERLMNYLATRQAGVRSQGFPSVIGYEMHRREPLLWQQLEEQVPKMTEEVSGTSQSCRLFNYILQLNLKSL